MATVKNTTISPNTLTYKKTSINLNAIKSIEYGKPKNIIWAIISNGFKYLIFCLFVIGIPFALYNVYLDMTYYRVIIQMHSGKEEKLYVTQEEYEFIKSNL